MGMPGGSAQVVHVQHQNPQAGMGMGMGMQAGPMPGQPGYGQPVGMQVNMGMPAMGMHAGPNGVSVQMPGMSMSIGVQPQGAMPGQAGYGYPGQPGYPGPMY